MNGIYIIHIILDVRIILLPVCLDVQVVFFINTRNLMLLTQYLLAVVTEIIQDPHTFPSIISYQPNNCGKVTHTLISSLVLIFSEN